MEGVGVVSKTVTLSEVWKELQKWIQDLDNEVNSMLANQAVQRVSAGEAERIYDT